MNDLIETVRTMDSREIAELLDARHADIVISIETQLPRVGYTANPYTYVNEQNGQIYRHYKLPYRETMILVSGYSVELRAKIIDRWMELERAAAPAIPKTFAEALQLAADLQAKIEQDAPKLESHAALMVSEEDESITKAMKSFGLHPRLHVFPFLIKKHYLTGTGDKYDPYLPSQKALDEKLMVKRETVCEDGKVRGQARIQKCQLDNWRVKMIPRIEEWLRLEDF